MLQSETFPRGPSSVSVALCARIALPALLAPAIAAALALAPATPVTPAPSAAEAAPKKKRGPTVLESLRKAARQGKISRSEHREYRSLYHRARRTRKRMGGPRRGQLHAVIALLERIARDGKLSSTRMPALFLTLRRNTEFWPERAWPAAGARIDFPGSEVIFQPYPGQGLQIQPWLTLLRANELWEACNGGVRLNPELECDPERLRTVLDEAVELAANRGGFRAWEYYFDFGGGRPPWISSLSQGAGIQALARGGTYLGKRSYLTLAHRALRAFERRAPQGLRIPRFGGNQYLGYSFNRGLLILNQHVRSLVGLYDYWQITGSDRARKLFARGDRSARRQISGHDTGAWSLYSYRGSESDLVYHRVVRNFLRELCERTGTPIHCRTVERFSRYLQEHPRLTMLGSELRARKRSNVRFRLSKVSSVRLRIMQGERLIRLDQAQFPYGKHAFVWVPPRPGTYEIKLEAIDFLNHRTSVKRDVTVR